MNRTRHAKLTAANITHDFELSRYRSRNPGIDPRKHAAVGESLIRSIGFVAALKLIDVHGGKMLEIKLDDECLVEIVGTENLKYLFAKSRPNGRLYVPLYRSVKHVSCNQEIIPLYAQLIETMSGRDAVGTLAVQYNMAQRTVENIVNHYYESRYKSALPRIRKGC